MRDLVWGLLLAIQVVCVAGFYGQIQAGVVLFGVTLTGYFALCRIAQIAGGRE